MIIDTHAHYDDEQFDEDREEILGKMQDAGIGMIMDAGSTILSWDKIVKLTLCAALHHSRAQMLGARLGRGALVRREQAGVDKYVHGRSLRRGAAQSGGAADNFSPFSVRPAVVKLQRFESSAVFYFRMREVLSLTEKTSHSWPRINAS